MFSLILKAKAAQIFTYNIYKKLFLKNVSISVSTLLRTFQKKGNWSSIFCKGVSKWMQMVNIWIKLSNQQAAIFANKTGILTAEHLLQGKL